MEEQEAGQGDPADDGDGATDGLAGIHEELTGRGEGIESPLLEALAELAEIDTDIPELFLQVGRGLGDVPEEGFEGTGGGKGRTGFIELIDDPQRLGDIGKAA